MKIRGIHRIPRQSAGDPAGRPLSASSGTQHLLLLVLSAALLQPIPDANAQAPSPADIDAASREAEAIQRDLRDRAEQQRLRDLEPARPPARIEVPVPEPKARDGGPCREIGIIELKGASLLGARDIDDILARYRGTCMGVVELERLLSEVTAAYIRKGYIGARAYLPQQDLSTGTLVIEVIEGQVEGVRIDDGGKKSISVMNVAPGMVGKPLDLRDLEQALDQVNRLASNNASFDIEPGSRPGDSVVVLRNVPQRAWRGMFTYDNHGARNTGREQVGVTVMGDNPLGFNDFISVGHRRSHPYKDGVTASESSSLTYVLPYGYSTFNLSVSESEYAATISAPSGVTLSTHGTSRSAILGADHLLYRDGASLLRGMASITVKESKNYLEDILLQVSSRRLSVLDLDFSYTTLVAGGMFSLQLGYAKGLTAFNALRDGANLPSWAPRAQFGKIKYGFSYALPFKLLNTDFMLASNLVGQKSEDVLYGSEQISIGGIYSVRGFVDNTLAGDDGYFIRNELSLIRQFSFPNGPSGHVKPYLALDHGEVRNRIDGVPEGRLTGAAVGIGFRFGVVSLDVFHSHPLSYPSFMEREKGETWFRLSATL